MQKTDDTRDRKIEAVIFDMDNTLFDFISAKLKACKTVVSAIGNTDEMELIDCFINNPIDIENLDSIAQYLKHYDVYNDDLFDKCCSEYNKIKLKSLKVYPNVESTLETLQTMGLKLGLVTDAFYNNAQLRLKATGLLDFFEVIITADMTNTKKPQPDTLLLALKKLNVKPKNAVYVGDSLRRDIEPANRLGMITIHAKYGNSQFHEKRKGNADHIINNINEVIEIVKLYI